MTTKEKSMSRFRFEQLDHRHQATVPPDATVLRAVGIVILIGIGAMHFLQIVTTFQATPMLGGAYVALIGACLAAAGALMIAPGWRAWAAGGAVCLAALVGYAFTRLISTPFDNQDVGNWACMLGLAALFVEGAMVALSSYALAIASPKTTRAALAPAVRSGRRPEPGERARAS
jgi:hypothetical protein